jgi:2'-5' RNA ligase
LSREAKRLFFALRPDQEVCEQLVQLQHDCRQPGARVHRAENLHMTLAFLGMVDEGRIETICSMASCIKESGFRLRLDHTGYWRRPKILWCAPSHTPQHLASLVKQLWQGLEGCGFEQEQREYRPHVTLMRKAAAVKPQQLKSQIIWPVSHFELMWSHHKDGALHYETLDRWMLVGSK